MKISIVEYFRENLMNHKSHDMIKRSEHEFHQLGLEKLSSICECSLSDGLTSEQAASLIAKNGKNSIKRKSKNIFLKLISYLFTGFCGLLWLASIICIIAWKPLGNPPDPLNLGLGIMLMIVVLLQAAFSIFQDWSSSKVMNSIKNMIPSAATVIRDGHEHKIPVENLVVGDLVVLSYGSKVPADVRIIESHDLKFDKSMLTGESEPIDGTVECTSDCYVESKNIAFMTTLITNGQGKGIVVNTGDKTMIGTIASLTTQTQDVTTTLQKELRRFVIIIASVAVFTAVCGIIVWATWLRVKYPHYIDVPTLMVNTISVLVAFIPEGLPVCVTLSLLIVAKRMAKSRVLVKNLATIETLSCVDVIASDKTGTLTQNKMFVSNASVGIEAVKIGNSSETEVNPRDGKKSSFSRLLSICALCNNASFDEDDMKTPIKQRLANGDATDIALLKFSAENLTWDLKDITTKYTILNEIPFNSKNKWMMKIVKPADEELHEQLFGIDVNDPSRDFNLMLLKGAPDILLKKCRTILQKNGEETPLTATTISDLIKLQNEWCIQGQRVLLLCMKRNVGITLSQCQAEEAVDMINDFCVVGMVGIIDPPREGIEDVVGKCRKAGIRVFMVTGDYALTAAAIASQIGIFTQPQFDTAEQMRLKIKENFFQMHTEKKNPTIKRSQSLLLTGNDLECISVDNWRAVTQYEEIVFARTTPEQKLRIVKEFQRDGHIVGVTGDGVNDAPALKSANIGIAMGSGSEVAMEAAQLILMDNNFSSILTAVKNGRLVFANLRKVILYLLPGGCMAELIPVLMAFLLGANQDLSSFQMLIISLFTDIGPCLSLMMEKPETDLLAQPPRSKYSHLVDWKFLLQAYVFLGVQISIFVQIIFFAYMKFYANFGISDIIFQFGGWQDGFKNMTLNQINEHMYTGQTVTFVALVLLQVTGNLWSTRTNVRSFFQQLPFKKASRNIWIFIAGFVSIGIMLSIVFVPVFNTYFNTRPIPIEFFFIPLAFSMVILVLEETRKLFVRRKILGFHFIGW